MFHCLNAYEDAHGRILVDLCQYNDGFDVSTMWAAHGPVTLDRWTIDPGAGTVTQQRLDDRGQEFPRVDDRVVSRPHRYGYSAVIGEVFRAITATGDFPDAAFTNAILKHDLVHGTVQAHEFGRDATAGEAVFAPATPDSAEDDGYVMAFVHNPDRGAADLVLLAAQDFTSEPVARFICRPASHWASMATGSPTTNSGEHRLACSGKTGTAAVRSVCHALASHHPQQLWASVEVFGLRTWPDTDHPVRRAPDGHPRNGIAAQSGGYARDRAARRSPPSVTAFRSVSNLANRHLRIGQSRIAGDPHIGHLGVVAAPSIGRRERNCRQ